MGDPLPSHELAAFAAAVETGTVHGAAQALNLTQSAATKRIAALERHLEVRLLDRTRRGVTPTETGRLLYPEAKQALGALAAAERVVRERGGRAAVLRLAASQTIGEFLVPGWLAAFRTAADPGLVELHVGNSPAVLRELITGIVDLGFVEGNDSLDGFGSITLVKDEIVAVVSSGHPWARRRSVGLRDLEAEAFLTREPASGTRAVAEAALALHGVRLEPTAELASTQSLKRAVLSGGFTLVSRLAVQAEQQAGTLAALAVRGVELTRELRAVRVSGAPLPPRARRFWAFLLDEAARASR
jgi:DNA-binding transcriptional LysR family regulator